MTDFTPPTPAPIVVNATPGRDQAEALLHDIDATLSRFMPDSELSRLNRDPRALVPASALMQRFARALYFEPAAKRSSAGAPGPLARTTVRWRSGALILGWNVRWAVLIAALFVFGALGLSRPSEFLYWQF